MIRSHVKRTNSEPSSIALQVEREQRLNANRSHGDLNTVDLKSWPAPIRNEIPSQFTNKGASGDSCSASTSSSTSSPPSSPPPAITTTCSVSLSAQEELDQFPGSHFSFTSEYWAMGIILTYFQVFLILTADCKINLLLLNECTVSRTRNGDVSWLEFHLRQLAEPTAMLLSNKM